MQKNMLTGKAIFCKVHLSLCKVTFANWRKKMTTIAIPITKAKDFSLNVDLDQIGEDVYKYLLALGLKTVLNRGMSKITKGLMPNAETRDEEARLQADKNLANLYTGKVRMTGGVKPKGATGAVNTEAMRLARIAVKDMIKAANGKVSHYDASEITAAAKDLISQDTSYVEQAKANLEARNAVKPKVAIDVSKIAISAKKVAAAEAKKAKPKDVGQLSAKQAGKVKAKVPPKKGDKPAKQLTA